NSSSRALPSSRIPLFAPFAQFILAQDTVIVGINFTEGFDQLIVVSSFVFANITILVRIQLIERRGLISRRGRFLTFLASLIASLDRIRPIISHKAIVPFAFRRIGGASEIGHV